MPEIGEIRRAREIGRIGYNKHIWAACIDCGKERWVMLLKGEPISKRCCHCSMRHMRRNQKGALAPLWKGGRYKGGGGYIHIWLPPNDFFYPMSNKKGYVREHRLVIAKSLGRCLHPWEVVHHRNGIKTDNKLENLQLTSELGHKQITYFDAKFQQISEENKQLKQEIRLLRLELKGIVSREEHADKVQVV